MSTKTNRKKFLKMASATIAGLSLAKANAFPLIDAKRTIIGSNERIRVGFIGVGNRGTQLLSTFMKNPNCEVAALCDVYKPLTTRDYSQVNERYLKLHRIPKMGENFGPGTERYADYRKLLENKSIDAVCIASPDHWHALQTIDAIKAGKDVYVEKPMSKTITEGRAMINAARNSKQIVTAGLNRRAAPLYQKLAQEIPAGKIGKVSFAQTCHVSNMFPNGIGKMKPEAPPADFDWNMWLGPRAYRAYQYNIAPYMFRWWDDYANQISNNGVHFLDLIRWMLDEKAPVAVSAHGGKFVIDDDRTIPDTMSVTYEFASGRIVTINILEGSTGSFIPYGYIELRGTKGNIYTHENDYKLVPATAGQFQSYDKPMQEETFSIKDPKLKDSTTNLINNFLECIKSRKQPLATLEDGHLSTTMAHLGTIAMKTKQRLIWDAQKERFTNSVEANKHLHYKYRAPWKLV
ncbi:MAG: oxidoreductase [Sphingobacteriales bacterium 41-5]|nr:MAG: oxidoreductase [Sphingobacteriales bacterium 41-5]